MIDLHTHTIYSDGELTPNDLLKKAKNLNINTISITDHDCIDAYKHIDYPMFKDMKIINGIELSADYHPGTMHILGYGIDINNLNIINYCEKIKLASKNKIVDLIYYLTTFDNIIFDNNDINNLLNKQGNLGRPDLAKLLIKYGYAANNKDAFLNYLIQPYPAIQQKYSGLNPEECINLILEANGIPILAHPKRLELSNTNLELYLLEMIKLGLAGIEVYHSSHTKEEIEFYLYLVNRYNLLYSCGSDFHGLNVKPNVHLGQYNNKIKQLTLIDKLKNKL